MVELGQGGFLGRRRKALAANFCWVDVRTCHATGLAHGLYGADGLVLCLGVIKGLERSLRF